MSEYSTSPLSLPRHEGDGKDNVRMGDEKKEKEIAVELEQARAREKAMAREQAREREWQQEREQKRARETAAAVKEEMKLVLGLMDPLPERISELRLGSDAGPPGRRVTAEAEAEAQRCLAFLKKDLRAIVAGLRQLVAASTPGPELADSRITDRLSHLRELAGWIQDHLHGGSFPRRAAELPELNLSWIEQLLLVDSTTDDSHTTASSSVVKQLLPHPHSSSGNLPLVGIDGPRMKLLRWLTMALDGEEVDKKSLRVISVVGPAGVGKTTLAMELHRQTGGQYFQCYAAVKMSRRPLDTRKLLKHIMSQILDSWVSVTCEPCPSQITAALEGDEHELAYDMNEYLQDKRYLSIYANAAVSFFLTFFFKLFMRDICSQL
jgi:hypothetical protein